MKTIEITQQKPKDFFPKIEVAATYVNVQGKILLLKLAEGKSEAGFWGVPAGKLELQEPPSQAAKRELLEEAGINSNFLKPVGKLYIRKPNIDYVYYMFEAKLDLAPIVHLSAEHVEHKWVSRLEEDQLPLMQGAKEALNYYYQS